MRVTDDARIINAALYQFSRRETEALLNRIKNEPEPSAEFYEKLDNRVAEIKTQRQKSLSLKKTITILIAATLIIASLSVITYAIEKKTKIGGSFVEWFKGNMHLTTDTPYNTSVSPENVKVSYIPENFVLTDSNITSRVQRHKWEKNESYILILYGVNDSSGSLFVDTDGNNYTITHVGEIEVHRTINNGQIVAIWSDDKMLYALTCFSMEWEEMVKIIEGISYVEE